MKFTWLLRLCRTWIAMASALALMAMLSSCGTSSSDEPKDYADEPPPVGGWGSFPPNAVKDADGIPDEFTIATGTGMGYAAMVVMEQSHYYEREFPNTSFDWKELAGGAATTTALLSG